MCIQSSHSAVKTLQNDSKSKKNPELFVIFNFKNSEKVGYYRNVTFLFK